MGFESFQVALTGTGTYADAERALHARGIIPDAKALTTAGSACFLYVDQGHVVEVELSRMPLCISCRFTLCHPPSIISCFLKLLHELMTQLGWQATIRSDVMPAHDHPYGLPEFAEFSSAVQHYTELRRREWAAAFGSKHAALTTPQVHEQIILPRTQGAVESPR